MHRGQNQREESGRLLIVDHILQFSFLSTLRGSTHHTYRSIYLPDLSLLAFYTWYMNVQHDQGSLECRPRAAEASSNNSATVQCSIIDMVEGVIFSSQLR